MGGSAWVRRKNPRNELWNEVMKKSKHGRMRWKERCVEIYKEERRRVKGVYMRVKRR